MDDLLEFGDWDALPPDDDEPSLGGDTCPECDTYVEQSDALCPACGHLFVEHLPDDEEE